MIAASKIEGALDGGVRSMLERAVALALEEDLGAGDLGAQADLTTAAIVPAGAWLEAEVTAKAHGVVCGLEGLEVTFAHLDERVEVSYRCADGDDVSPASVLAEIRGPARAILVGERTALNLLSHLSGIATLTRRFCSRAAGTQIVDTRKTLPGLRALQKHAVRVGGGVNHRFALWDGVLVKDNHIAVAGSVTEATRRAVASTELAVQVECTTEGEVEEALEAGAHSLLLDNRSAAELRDLVAFARERRSDVVVEASGGVTLETVEELAATGVDRISIGALTHSAPGLDVSLDVKRVWQASEGGG